MLEHVFMPKLVSHPYFCFPESVGWYKDEPMHQSIREKESFQFFNLHVVSSGKGYLVYNGTTYTLGQGDAFLYYPGEAQNYFSDSEMPWEIMWVHFSGTFLKEYLTEKGFHLTPVWTLKLWKSVTDAILALLDEARQFTILHPATLSTLTYHIITTFVTQAIPLTPHKGFDIYNRIIAMLPKMREYSVQPFNLKYWADELEISTYYFCKIFKKAAGVTPNSFITLCRLQKAKQHLIENPDWSVKKVSLECGYPSISYFCRLFHQNEGISPGEYRQRQLT